LDDPRLNLLLESAGSLRRVIRSTDKKEMFVGLDLAQILGAVVLTPATPESLPVMNREQHAQEVQTPLAAVGGELTPATLPALLVLPMPAARMRMEGRPKR
jgi:hypothetical protein